MFLSSSRQALTHYLIIWTETDTITDTDVLEDCLNVTVRIIPSTEKLSTSYGKADYVSYDSPEQLALEIILNVSHRSDPQPSSSVSGSIVESVNAILVVLEVFLRDLKRFGSF